MAGGFKDFTASTALSADVDNYLMRQSVMRFASTAARDSALSGNLEDGMMCICLDTHSIFYYNGSAWKTISSPWTSYVPVWTNLTKGSATVVGNYRYQLGDLRVMGYITFAADTSITGTVFQTIPNGETAMAGWQGGTGQGNDVGSRVYPMVIGATSTTTWNWVHAESGNGGQVNATNPFTWATSDVLTWDFTVGLS